MLSFGCYEAIKLQHSINLLRYEYCRIAGYYWIASVSGIRKPHKTSGGPQIGSEASISSHRELHSLGKNG